MKDKKKIQALLLSLLFLCGVIAILIFGSFVTPLPLPEEQGVEIESAGGGGGSDGGNVTSDQNTTSASDEVVTQDTDEAPVRNNTKTNVKSNNTEPVKESPKEDSRISNIKWGQGTGNGQGNGNGNGIGPGSGNGSGGGDGDGIGKGKGSGYNLSGRGAKSIPMPAYDEEEQGKVVVTIYVDRDGNVLRAVPGAVGTTISTPSYWSKAKAAALKAKFSKNPDAPEEQKGTITYYFIRQN